MAVRLCLYAYSFTCGGPGVGLVVSALVGSSCSAPSYPKPLGFGFFTGKFLLLRNERMASGLGDR